MSKAEHSTLSYRALMIVLMAILSLSLVFACGCSSKAESSQDNGKSNSAQNESVEKDTANDDAADQEEGQATEEEKAAALEKASSLLRIQGFSKSGLANYLAEFEGFSPAAATYAAENCGADWNEQAVRTAQYYLKSQDMDRDRLIEQLEYEGYTRTQAEYGADGVGK